MKPFMARRTVLAPLAGLSFLAAGGLAACSSAAPTSILLRVRTDLSCDDLRTASIAVGDPSAVDTLVAQKVTTACEVFDRELSTVGTLVVVPSGATDAEIAVRVLGGVTRPAERCTAETGFKGCIVARRVLRFVPGREIEVGIDLRLECVDVACTAASTCLRGSCVAAALDSTLCGSQVGGCSDEALAGAAGASDGGGLPIQDGAPGPGPDGAPSVGCVADEKSCGGVCVKISDPTFGCTSGACAPCAGAESTTFTCDGPRCAVSACKPGFKSCGGACVPADPAHGCGGPCGACDATNGVASCAATGACALSCAGGYKLCGGKCVDVNDPTYGCSSTACDNQSCPAVPDGSTLTCAGGACVIGTCTAGTKACGQLCVPTDANNGCADSGRCTSCANGEQCVGAPSTCQCVPESPSVTCAAKACGAAVNNCGQTIQCPDTCSQLGAGYTCNGGNVGPNSCGCVADNAAACAGKACGSATNNCGQVVQCPDTCSALGPNYSCGSSGALPNQCGCVATPKTTACGTRQCGSAANGCGANYNCGNCTNYKFSCYQCVYDSQHCD